MVTSAVDFGPPIKGLDLLLDRRAVLVGEVHGTAEGPDVFGRIVGQLAACLRCPILVGLELPHANQAYIDTFLEADDSDVARGRLCSAPVFVGWQDGRGSTAMLALFERLHGMRRGGLPVEVVAFDTDDARATAVARDATMAKTLLAALGENPRAVLLTYSGNVHSRTVQGDDPGLMPMGVHLVQEIDGLLALDFASAGGSTWCCTVNADDDVVCGEHSCYGDDCGPDPFIERYAAPDEHGHHGRWYVGRTTASYPAVPVKG